MQSGRTEASGASTTQDRLEAFDRIRALEMTEGDEELLGDLILVFKQESGELMTRLESAIASGDHESVRSTAHRLKGASASVGGVKIATAARALETMGAMRLLAGAEGLLAQLQQLVEDYNRATASFGKGLK